MKTQRRQERTRTAGVYKHRTRRGDVYYARYRTKDRQQVGQTFTTLEEAEAFLVAEALRRADNNQGIAASLLGLTRQALNKRLVRGRQNSH